MGLLTQISIWEIGLALAILFTFLFTFLRTPQIISDREVSNLFILSRDFLEVIDNLNLTYIIFTNTSYFDIVSSSILKEKFYIPLFYRRNLIKERIIVAANCSTEEIEVLNTWFNEIKLNKRKISINFIQTSLSSIPYDSDVLIICGYKNLNEYKESLISYLNMKKGIVGIFDLQVIDQTTREIFGIDITTESFQLRDVIIFNPQSAYQLNYQPYKYFYGTPIAVFALGFNSTSGNYIGNFTFRDYRIPFEINSTMREVYFYTSQKITVREREVFSLYGYSFLLSYINNSTIFVSFRKHYNFTNFVGNNRVYVSDNNENRIFLFGGYYSSGKKIPVAVMNGSRVAWIADFNRYRNATDDQRLALLSLILSVSNKDFSYGYRARNPVLVPYVDVESYDVFEAYSINFGYSLP